MRFVWISCQSISAKNFSAADLAGAVRLASAVCQSIGKGLPSPSRPWTKARETSWPADSRSQLVLKANGRILFEQMPKQFHRKLCPTRVHSFKDGVADRCAKPDRTKARANLLTICSLLVHAHRLGEHEWIKAHDRVLLAHCSQPSCATVHGALAAHLALQYPWRPWLWEERIHEPAAELNVVWIRVAVDNGQLCINYNSDSEHKSREVVSGSLQF